MSEAWEVRMSSTQGVPYFRNLQTKDSSWETPASLTAADIEQFAGIECATVKVHASHLLVKHKESRNPRSWKQDPITLTKDEAIATLRQYQAQIIQGQSFKTLANEHSDCSSHERDGDLGWFSRGTMQKPFEEAAFSLKAGEMSELIETDSGVHILLCEGIMLVSRRTKVEDKS